MRSSKLVALLLAGCSASDAAEKAANRPSAEFQGSSGLIRSDADQPYVAVVECGEASGYLSGLEESGVLKR